MKPVFFSLLIAKESGLRLTEVKTFLKTNFRYYINSKTTGKRKQILLKQELGDDLGVFILNLQVIKIACRVRVDYLKKQNHVFFTVFQNKFLKHDFNIILKLNNRT